MHIAAEKGHEKIVKLLLNHQANDKAPDKFGQIPLHLAAENNHEEIIKIFLNRGVPLDSTTKDGVKSLHLASKKGHKDIVLFLLRYAAENNALTPIKLVRETGIVLYIAAYYRHENFVQCLLDQGIDPNIKLEKNLSPLQAAAQQGCYKVVELLLKHVSKTNPKDEDYLSMPLFRAARAGHVAIVQLLLNSGASLLNAKSEDNSSPMSVAVKRNHEVIVRRFLEVKADINGEINHEPIILAAVLNQHYKMIEMLLKYNPCLNYWYSCNQDVRFKQARTPLQQVVIDDNFLIAELLLKSGSIVDFSNENEIPLHYDVNSNKSKMINLLFDYGAHVDSVCTEGLTPLFHAVEHNQIEICQMLPKKRSIF